MALDEFNWSLTVVEDEQRKKDHHPLLFDRPIVDGESAHIVTEPALKGGELISNSIIFFFLCLILPHKRMS